MEDVTTLLRVSDSLANECKSCSRSLAGLKGTGGFGLIDGGKFEFLSLLLSFDLV